MGQVRDSNEYGEYLKRANRTLEAIPVDDLGLDYGISGLNMVDPIPGITEAEWKIIHANTSRLSCDPDAHREKLLDEIHRTHLRAYGREDNILALTRNTAIADAYNVHMKRQIQTSCICRFVNIYEMEQIVETGRFSNVDMAGNLHGNWELDGYNTKSFTLTRYHPLQNGSPIRIMFESHSLPLEAVDANPFASWVTTMKHGLPTSVFAISQLELRLPINESDPPKVPEGSTINIPPNAAVSEKMLKKIRGSYKVTLDENNMYP